MIGRGNAVYWNEIILVFDKYEIVIILSGCTALTLGNLPSKNIFCTSP